MTRMRQTIATRLKDAQNTAALLTTFNDVDMTAVMEARAKYKDLFEKKHAIRLGFMGFFVKACALAAKDVPSVNASLDGEDIVYKNHYDVGVAEQHAVLFAARADSAAITSRVALAALSTSSQFISDCRTCSPIERRARGGTTGSAGSIAGSTGGGNVWRGDTYSTIAGGTGLAVMCDLTIAVPEAKFGYTEVRIGFVPAIVSTFLLRQVGYGT